MISNNLTAKQVREYQRIANVYGRNSPQVHFYLVSIKK